MTGSVPPSGAPLVSIVTPCWNAERYLAATYRSLRAQTMTNWEWLVADDGSTDGGVALLRRIAARDARVRLVPGGHTGLPAVGRNRALARTSGRFVAFLDADDVWHPEKLERQLAFLRTHRGVAMTYSFVQEFWSPEWGRREAPPVFWPRVRLPDDPFAFLLRRGNVVCTSSLLVRRAVVVQLGGFDEDPELCAVEDHDFLLRAVRWFRLGRTPGVLVRYRLHPANVTRTIDFGRTEALRRKLEERGDLRGRAGAGFLSAYYLKRAERGLAGMPGVAVRRDFLRALACDPLDPRRWAAGVMAAVLPSRLLGAAYRGTKRLQRHLEGRAASPHHLGGQME
ncbi:MAG: teichuronic acid biosynthesis glycosyltransferase TuaG [Candidatus Sumerlaeota bacterium]|nr:teichuronic acid biosynthesis glycosyltransferase TuaG [Candidatus Sumerlaeota bacterium]